MDLRFPNVDPSPEEVDALQSVLGPTTLVEGWTREQGGPHRAAAMRHLLLPALHVLVDRVGSVSEGGLTEICRRLDVPPAEAYGVATFYSMLPVDPVPLTTVYVCEDLVCRRGGVATGPAAEPGTRVVHAPCIGLCEQAPASLTVRSGPKPDHSIASTPPANGSVPQMGDPSLVLLRRIGTPPTLGSYLDNGGYVALRRALDIGPAAVIDEVTASRLVGRGGAAFPTGRKWAAVASQPAGPRFIVANADESEPGTFKDRVLLEGDPFALVESMTIAAFAVGAERGYLYLRDEYRSALGTLEAALASARSAGFLGTAVLGSPLAFDIEIVRGAGAYICGEETAIFNSIEGH
ncbi:MAG: NADH-quinone oxidoreductase subunit E, partial [Actinobacteria bacterium]|nr:NADH-quinone oxidoreductase subunit E [Actinomycetota bacterium]